MTPKTYKPTPTLNALYNAILIVFTIVLLMTIYGIATSFLQSIQQDNQLSLTLSKTLLILLPLLFLGVIIILTIMGSIILLLTANITIQVGKQGFRVITLIYKSDWLSWDKVKKARSFSFKKGNQITQLGIDDLHWMFKLNGLLFWMLPCGTIVVGEKSMQDGHKLLRTFRQKCPDVFGP